MARAAALSWTVSSDVSCGARGRWQKLPCHCEGSPHEVPSRPPEFITMEEVGRRGGDPPGRGALGPLRESRLETRGAPGRSSGLPGTAPTRLPPWPLRRPGACSLQDALGGPLQGW